jgi:hypothetical protein
MDSVTSPQPAPRRDGFSVAAIAAPFIGTFVFIVMQSQRSHEMASGLAGIAPLIFGGGGGGMAGVALALCALVRGERPLLTCLGFLLCVPLAALFLVLLLA